MSNITNLIPTIMSAELLSDNLDYMEKKHKKSKDFVKQGIKNILGVTLISSTAKLV